MLTEIRRLWAHARWADTALLGALSESSPPEALGELAHVVAAEEVWLARLEQRPSRVPVWPVLTLTELHPLAARVHDDLSGYLASLDDAALPRLVRYTNSAGRTFENTVADILLHAALHGQYHRGKINLLLRQAGLNPAPTDYIAFVRGAPAATQSPGRS
jgi:uncharacterized damage-inducible protein DinB